MVSTIHSVSQAPITFATPSFNKERMTRQIQARLHTDVSENQLAVPIPPAVKRFFTHRFADLHMFVQAFGSMSNEETNPIEIDRRITQILQLKNAANTNENNRQAVCDLFVGLAPQTQSLFSLVNADYINAFRTQTDLNRIERIREEISRECEQVIFYQRTLKSVSVLFRTFLEMIESVFGLHSTSRARTANHWETWWNDLLGRSRPSSRTGRADEGWPSGNTSNIDVNIPDTIPYSRRDIPPQVQEKANQIARLKVAYERLGDAAPRVPEAFKDPISLEKFMKIPVFDASHPRIQADLPKLREELAAGNISNLDHYRNARHALDKESLELYPQGENRFVGANCPLCRHPQNAEILMQTLRIDTGLQDAILGFLQANLPRDGIVTS
jgi:hypothetical protein